MHDIFISYSFDDQQQVEYIANRLSSRYGITYWLCTREIRGGQHYKRMIAEAIKDAGAVVLFYSTNAADSREIPKEVSIAFDKEKMIIPFRLDKAEFCGDLYYDLVGVEYIDGTKPEFWAGMPARRRRRHSLY